ncbi:peptidoglycan editing factor PgeF [Pseudomonas putida]|uniref:Purine nucleoside phosphorylase n=1 Tax=Pseudomonas putida TaxID=303 RepID=A0AAD0L586_PSEPU|nr:peptidoglycan editing factor PgeF [Pseudomonas putida]AXA23342.1 peptidoglycan editing factor PgeF [Pseudomonas putida]
MSELTQSLIFPDWPAPASVRACVTIREGGVSLPPYETFNLGDHVGDDPAAVAENRRRLGAEFAIQPAWLKQVHGLVVADADPAVVAEADASWTDQPGIACTVMTADCLPALFCDRAGTRVAAAHAGWRGLAGGVLEATLDRLALAPEEVLVWLGPAIGPRAFEVGLEVRDAFTAVHPEAASAFVAGQRPDKLIADIYALARIRLAARGVTAVYGGGFCTVSDPRFFSYRRTPQGGRFASLVWLEPR